MKTTTRRPLFRAASFPVPLLLPLLLSFLFPACASPLKGVVSDVNGLHREVGSLSLNKGKYLLVLDGLAERKVPLKKVSIIRLSAAETLTHENRLYYLAEIWLTNGDNIQSYTLPDGRATKAYMNVDCGLKGRIDRAPWSIRMTDVRSVKLERD